MATAATSVAPVRLSGRRDPELSRWLWLVKPILLIPHVILLALLWPALVLLTFVAWVAVWTSGRYPLAIQDFNAGVLRWSWRVAFYGFGALGTDRYPPFTLGAAPDYPAQLELARPREQTRWKAFLRPVLALPQLIIVGLLVGAGGWALGQPFDVLLGSGFITVLVAVAGVVLLFRGRYPSDVFDLVLGLNRWVARVAVYTLVLAEPYPPFRLDAGGEDPGSLPAQALAPPRSPGKGRATLTALGGILGTGAIAAVVVAVALAIVDVAARDDDFLMSPTATLSSGAPAVLSPDVDLHGGAPPGLRADDVLGTVRVQSTSSRPVFLGITRSAVAERALRGVAYDRADDLSDGDVRLDPVAGGAPRWRAPGSLPIWAASSVGAGRQRLDWRPRDGRWALVVADPAGRPGIEARVRIGARVPHLASYAWGIAGGAVLAGGLATLLLVLGLRRPRDP
jgi:hypothetical protein